MKQWKGTETFVKKIQKNLMIVGKENGDRDYHGGEDSEDEQGVGDSDDNISEDDTQDEHRGERDVMMDFSDGGEARKAENIQRDL